MAERRTVIVLSDVHYAGAEEIARGWHESEIIENHCLRLAVRAYRYFIWRRDPFAHNYLLDRFCQEAPVADYVIANGDYSCDTAFVGVSDEPAYRSAEECLAKLRQKFGAKLHLTIGDHELGKRSLFGGRGGMRLMSWQRTTEGLDLKPFWKFQVGRYVFIGITSSLVALPVYRPETISEEHAGWEHLRNDHMNQICDAFIALEPTQRVVLFCHDPTALPFLWKEEPIRDRIDQITQTILGHLHSRFYLWQSKLLAGLPTISWMGYSIRRMTAALKEARLWLPFRIRLCPALAGIQLLKDGGYLCLEFDDGGDESPTFEFRPLPWKTSRNNQLLSRTT